MASYMGDILQRGVVLAQHIPQLLQRNALFPSLLLLRCNHYSILLAEPITTILNTTLGNRTVCYTEAHHATKILIPFNSITASKHW